MSAAITTSEGLAQDEALALASAVERDSEHTIALGIVKSSEIAAYHLPKDDPESLVDGRLQHRGIPLAAGVLAPRRIVLQPAVGAVMSLRTIIVAVNAQLLRRVRL